MKRVLPFALLGALVLTAADKKPDVILVVDAGPEQYPADTPAQRPEGDVAVKLHVGPDGALRCTAEPNETLSMLRRPSCALIAARDIFAPRLVDGKSVATDFDLIVRWSAKADNSQFGGAIPISRARWITARDYPARARNTMNSGKVDVAFTISAMGRVQGCKVTRSNTDTYLVDAVCPLLEQRAAFLPALDDKGVPRATTGVFHTYWRYCSSSDPDNCPKPDADAK